MDVRSNEDDGEHEMPVPVAMNVENTDGNLINNRRVNEDRLRGMRLKQRNVFLNDITLLAEHDDDK